MKKTREYYVCDICGAEAPEQPIQRRYGQMGAYSTNPIGWEKGFNVHVDICPKCTEKLKEGEKHNG